MSIKSKKVVVTGGCGFIGSHLVENLAGMGNEVVIIDNLVSGRVENISGIDGNITHHNVSVLDKIDDYIADADVIFHLAANVFVTKSVEDPPYDAENNIKGTLNVLETARKLDIKNIVYSSSSAVYGDKVKIPTDEAQRTAPTSPYGVSKLAGEIYTKVYASLYGLKTVALRYFNVYGIRQAANSPYSGVIALFIRNAIEKKPIAIYGDGAQSRDFVSVRNVVMANLAAAGSKVKGEVFNIGTGKETTINRLADIIASFSGELNRNYEPPRIGDIKQSVADISRAVETLDYKPSVSLEEGLKELYDSYQKAD
jgi:UDP-glucose 4-epimerase